MKTILTSISLLILSILLVIGCEVIESSIHNDEHSVIKTESVQESQAVQSTEEITNIKLEEMDNDQDDLKPKPSES